MSKPIIFWGAGGHARVLNEFVGVLGYRLVALFDNNTVAKSPFPGVPVLYGWDSFTQWRHGQDGGVLYGLVAIGGHHGAVRLSLQDRLQEHGVDPVVVIHPTAYIARREDGQAGASIGKGTQILAGSIVGIDATIGRGCIINTRASVDHECILEDGVHLAPAVTLAGGVTVGMNTVIGAAAVVLPQVHVGRNAFVGSGAVVTRNVPDGKVVYGNPARVQRDHHV